MGLQKCEVIVGQCHTLPVVVVIITHAICIYVYILLAIQKLRMVLGGVCVCVCVNLVWQMEKASKLGQTYHCVGNHMHLGSCNMTRDENQTNIKFKSKQKIIERMVFQYTVTYLTRLCSLRVMIANVTVRTKDTIITTMSIISIHRLKNCDLQKEKNPKNIDLPGFIFFNVVFTSNQLQTNLLHFYLTKSR